SFSVKIMIDLGIINQIIIIWRNYTMSKKALTYLDDNRERLLKKLNEFLSIPSVSTDSQHKHDIKKKEKFMKTNLREIRFERIKKIKINRRNYTMSKKALTYLADNRERLLKKLNEFLSIPSVSTDSQHKHDIKKAADFLQTYLGEIGFENIEQKDTGGHPLVD